MIDYNAIAGLPHECNAICRPAESIHADIAYSMFDIAIVTQKAREAYASIGGELLDLRPAPEAPPFSKRFPDREWDTSITDQFTRYIVVFRVPE